MAAVAAKNLAAINGMMARHDSTGRKQGIAGGGEDHMLVGPTGSGDTQWHHRSFIRFDMAVGNFTDVDQVLSALIFIEENTAASQHPDGGASPNVEVRRVKKGEKWSFTGKHGEADWDPEDYDWPAPDAVVASRTPFPKADRRLVSFDVSNSIGAYLPTGVKGPDGKAGLHLPNYGFILMADTETNKAQFAVFQGRYGATAGGRRRPYLRITYLAKNRKPDAPTSLTPNGDTPRNASFEGVHNDPDLSPMSGYQIIVYPKGEARSRYGRRRRPGQRSPSPPPHRRRTAGASRFRSRSRAMR